MSRPELGGKRQCQTCGTKFFDLNRDPIICPKCGATFQALPVARAPTRPSAAAQRDEVEADPAGVELVSLEDAEGADKPAAVSEDDIEVDDTPADDAAFLEEEEEADDNVSDLIDGDIEDDEEG